MLTTGTDLARSRHRPRVPASWTGQCRFDRVQPPLQVGIFSALACWEVADQEEGGTQHCQSETQIGWRDYSGQNSVQMWNIAKWVTSVILLISRQIFHISGQHRKFQERCPWNATTERCQGMEHQWVRHRSSKQTLLILMPFFISLQRNENGRFRDADLASILMVGITIQRC